MKHFYNTKEVWTEMKFGSKSVLATRVMINSRNEL